VLIVRATKKLLDRIGPPNVNDGEQSTTMLGPWYATAVFWKPQVALFVNEPPLLPVLVPLAPATTLLARFPQQAATVLAAHGTPDTIIGAELRQMHERRRTKTANRSVVGMMNEFTYLAEVYCGDTPAPDLLGLAMRLATTLALRPPLQQTRQPRPRTGRTGALHHTSRELTRPTMQYTTPTAAGTDTVCRPVRGVTERRICKVGGAQTIAGSGQRRLSLLRRRLDRLDSAMRGSERLGAT
jgi:hypothetical protein